MNYAPIAVFVYKRPDKTKRLFESLIKNPLAKNSEVYVFSDGPRDKDSGKGVSLVREYVDGLKDGGFFKKLTSEYSETNKGLASSVIGGVTRLLDEFGRVIVLEDDLVLSEFFLDYMNECLDHYEKDGRIWSISGYSSIPAPVEGYDKNIYLNYRASSWGWATWKDRWALVDWDMRDYGRFRFDPAANLRFCYGGNDLPSMLRAQMKGKIDSWAVRFCYHQTKNRMFSIAPVRSLVQNEGLDGTGVHCAPGDDNGFGSVRLENEKREWACDDLKLDKRIVRLFYKQHHLSIYVRIRDKIRELS